MRKCILSNEMKPKKDMIRVVQNKEGEISADATGKKNKVVVHMYQKMLNLLKKHKRLRN